MNTADPSAGFQDRVEAAASELSPRERAVVQYLIDRPDEAVTASAAEIAAASGASDATVVRAARTLGYPGLRELKRALMKALTEPADPAAVLDHRVRRAATPAGSVLDHVLADTRTLLDQLTRVMGAAAWHDAVALLEAAPEVWLYGAGPAGHTAQYHALELRRLGRRARAVTTTGFELADSLIELGPDSLVVIHAPLRLFREIDVLIAHAGRVGAKVIVITEALRAAVHERVDVVLTTPTSTIATTSEYLAGQVLVHAISLELASRDQVSAVAARNQVLRLRAAIVGPVLDPRPESASDD